MNHEPDEPYLWDRSGDPDPDVVALERVLGRFGCTSTMALQPRRVRRGWPWVLAAAAVLAVGAVLTWSQGATPSDALAWRVVEVSGEPGAAIEVGGAFSAGPERRELRLGGLVDVTLEPGAQIEVRELSPSRTRLFLAEGVASVFVMLDAGPRFFQIDTPHARCVDLGCQYDLAVAPDDGSLRVAVQLGRIALEAGDAVAYVPRGAEARATSAGLGTPRFVPVDPTAPFFAALDDYDRAPSLDAARAVISAYEAREELQDSLSLWHMLAAGSSEVAAEVEQSLIRTIGVPPEGLNSKQPGGLSPSVWRAYLAELWD